MKYIPDAMKQVAFLSLAIPIIILITVGLWIKKAVRP